MPSGTLLLEDGSRFHGQSFGYPTSVSGEVVFNTGMVGYPEALTDPSYYGQILVLTYPLIGNYGVPDSQSLYGLLRTFESEKIHIQGLIVSDYSWRYSHWAAAKSLEDWLQDHRIPALCGIDTRMLCKRLREKGTMLGKLLVPKDQTDAFESAEKAIEWYDPNKDVLVSKVSINFPIKYNRGKQTVVVVDCGCKHSILHALLSRNISVLRVPWNYNFLEEKFDGVVVSNGPGNPQSCSSTIGRIQQLLKANRPIFGICLGHQLLALAAGGETYKLKYGHRSQNQPCVEAGTQRCHITSQNHGYAVRPESLSRDWEPWFTNANDGTNEGLRHRSRPFVSVQFHPEAAPGPTDTNYLFDRFLSLL